MSVHTERMMDRHVEAVAAIEHALFRSNLPLDEATARLREDLRGPLMRAWVARIDAGDPGDPGGPIVGYALVLHAADELHVLNVATTPAERRRGVGRALVDALLAFAARSAVRLVVLEVRRSNRDAIRLYRRAGFAAITLRRRYYPDDEDAIEMHLAFDPATGAVVPHADEVKID